MNAYSVRGVDSSIISGGVRDAVGGGDSYTVRVVNSNT